MTADPDTPDELMLVGFETFTEHGFALPCFGQAEGANTLYVARTSRPGDPLSPVAGFDLYEAEQPRPYPRSKGHHNVKVGDGWLDVFLWRGDVFAGTRPDIWTAVKSLRADIAAHAPLSLLNLAEGVVGLSTGGLARTAFAWLEAHRGVKAASEWRIDTYLRGIAIRNLRRRQSSSILAGQIRSDLRNVELTQSGATLVLRLPHSLRLAIPSDLPDFEDLLRAARAFNFRLAVADLPMQAAAAPHTRAPAPSPQPVLLMRLRKGRSDTQTQIPFRLVDTFFTGATKIQSAHSGRTRAMTQSSSGGRRNTMKFEVPEMRSFRLPVARIERTLAGFVYEVYDSESLQGQKIMKRLDEGRRTGATKMTDADPAKGTWWRIG